MARIFAGRYHNAVSDYAEDHPVDVPSQDVTVAVYRVAACDLLHWQTVSWAHLRRSAMIYCVRYKEANKLLEL